MPKFGLNFLILPVNLLIFNYVQHKYFELFSALEYKIHKINSTVFDTITISKGNLWGNKTTLRGLGVDLGH